MRILLLNPPRYEGIPVIREERCEITERYSILEPYSLLQIGSIIRNSGHEVELVDANGLDLDYQDIAKVIGEKRFDMVFFRFTPTTFDWDMKTAEVSKKNKPDSITVGICWTLGDLAHSVMSDAKSLDIFVRHEYEVVMPRLVSAIEKGDLSRVDGIAYRNEREITVNGDAEPISDFDSLPLPAYDLLPSLKPYFINTPHGSPFTIMYTSKGCPFKCIYCTVAQTKWKVRSAKRVLEELRYLKNNYDIRTVSFFDETFTLKRDRVIDIAESIRDEKLDIVWYCNTRVHLVDEDLLRVMKEGGCRGISFGIESGSQKILNDACKGTTVEDAKKAVKLTKKEGIKAYCSFILGLPGEDWSTVKQTLDFVKETLPTGAQFNVAVPYPDTVLYEIALERGWIEEADWRRFYQDEAIMRTDALSTEDLNRARDKAYRTLYFNPRWIFQNIRFVLRNTEDFPLATRYWFKIMNNYVVHRMKHAH
jgi:radical SAM superfamily enzyme YgiQ (UPF0313 family)